MNIRFLFYKTKTSLKFFYSARVLVFVLCITSVNIIAQSVALKGQMWGSLLRGDDPPIGRSNFEQKWGYIPVVSYTKDLANNSLLDLEWGHKLGKVYAGDYSIGSLDAPYRLWFRYSSDLFEARLGLQKISFGPAMILR